MKTEISGTMRAALHFSVQYGGELTRYPGGFWAGNDGVKEVWFGTSTVEALVKRGLMEYVEWKETHGRKFPICARTVAP